MIDNHFNFSNLYFQRSFSFILIILLAHVESFTCNQIIEQTGRNIFLVYYLFTCSSLCHQNQLAVKYTAWSCLYWFDVQNWERSRPAPVNSLSLWTCCYISTLTEHTRQGLLGKSPRMAFSTSAQDENSWWINEATCPNNQWILRVF